MKQLKIYIDSLKHTTDYSKQIGQIHRLTTMIKEQYYEDSEK